MPTDHDINKLHGNLHQRAKELREEVTPMEEKLWQAVRSKRLGGFKFRRQHPIGPYIVDFFCFAKRLVIEIDGEVHQQQKDYDEARTLDLNDRGYSVLRFTNEEVDRRFDQVLKTILEKLSE